MFLVKEEKQLVHSVQPEIKMLPTTKNITPIWKPDILFEDEQIVVINKKAGIAVHEGKTVSYKDSLLGHLTSYYKPKTVTPHLVHRLDKNTSGCLLIVKQESLIPYFEKIFEGGQVDKTYIALVKGILQKKAGKIDTPLPGRDGMLVHALSTYTVDRVYEKTGVSLVTVKIETGRMHQIRLHFTQLGYPVVMDEEHGDFTFNKTFRKKYKLRRQFLHAATLSFAYQEEKRTFVAPPPLRISLPSSGGWKSTGKARNYCGVLSILITFNTLFPPSFSVTSYNSLSSIFSGAGKSHKIFVVMIFPLSMCSDCVHFISTDIVGLIECA